MKRKAVDRTRPSSPKRSKLKVSEDESSFDEEWTGIQAKGARISEECDVTDSGSCSGGSGELLCYTEFPCTHVGPRI